MSVCPWCKSPVASSSAPCPRCGRSAADHPSIAAVQGRNLSTDFDDDDDGVPDIARGSSVGGHAPAQSSYEASSATFDADLMDDDAGGASLELDMPPMPAPPPPPELAAAPPTHVSRPGMQAVRPSQSMQAVRPSQSMQAVQAPPSGPVDEAPPPPPEPQVPAAPPKPDPASIIARYPEPPEPNKVWLMPVYACKVVYRQFELRMDLTSLRRRRSPDVGLYERALKVYEPRAFFIGLAITGVVVCFATVLFFMPVILRFARAPD